MRQSVTTLGWPASRDHASTASPSTRPAPSSAMLGQHGREAEEAGAGRQREALCPDETSIGQPTAAPTTSPSCSTTNVANRGSSKSASYSARASSTVGSGSNEKTGDSAWCAGSATSILRERIDVVPGRRAERELRRHVDDRVGGPRLADRMDVLVPEADAKPRVDEGRVRRGHDRVVGGQPGGDPAWLRPRRRGRARARPPPRRARPARPRRSGPSSRRAGRRARKPVTSPSIDARPRPLAPSRASSASTSAAPPPASSYAGSSPGSRSRCAGGARRAARRRRQGARLRTGRSRCGARRGRDHADRLERWLVIRIVRAEVPASFRRTTSRWLGSVQ